MKHKIQLLTVLLCLFGIISVHAQRRTITKEYYKQTTLVNIPGKLTYGYVAGDDGTNLYDGPYTIQCNMTNYKKEMYPFVFTINGTYSLRANYQKGNLHGVMTASYKLPVTKYSRSTGSETITESQTFSGSFSNGIPHGVFKVTGKIDGHAGSMSVSYNNGDLVGAYKCEVFDKGQKVNINGVLTQDSELSGTWTVQRGSNSKTMQFVNRVLVHESEIEDSALSPVNRSTTSKISELSKQYASGSISKEELFDKRIEVKKDSLILGNYARIAIFYDSGVDFDSMTGYDFSKPNAKVYEYLVEVPFLSESGLQELARRIALYTQEGTNAYYDFGHHETNAYKLDKYRYDIINLSDENSPYLMMYPKNPEYFTCGVDKRRGEIKTYITKEQLDYVEKQISVHQKANAITLRTWMIYNGTSDIKRYLNNLDNSSYTIDERSEQSKVASVKRLMKLINDINSCLKIFEEHSENCSDDENLVLYSNNNNNKKEIRYVNKNSITEFKETIQKLQQDIDKANEELEVAKSEALKKKAEEDLAQVKKELKPAIDFILEGKTASSITSSGIGVSRHVYSFIESELQSGFYKYINEFCPIIGFEIIGVGPNYNSVECKITKQGKKKVGNTTYQIVLVHKDGKFLAESFDITKAKQVQ